MPSCDTYYPTWVSHTLDVGISLHGYSSKHRICSLPWMRGMSLPPPVLPSTWESSSRPSCACSATDPRVAAPGCGPWPRALVAQLSTGKSRGTPRVLPSLQKTTKSLSPVQINLISLHLIDWHPEYRLSPRWQV